VSEKEYSFEYDINESGDLVRGDRLYFAYSGSGVATLIDAAGTGYRVRVGEHNLKGIGPGKLILGAPEDEPEDEEETEVDSEEDEETATDSESEEDEGPYETDGLPEDEPEDEDEPEEEAEDEDAPKASKPIRRVSSKPKKRAS